MSDSEHDKRESNGRKSDYMAGVPISDLKSALKELRKKKKKIGRIMDLVIFDTILRKNLNSVLVTCQNTVLHWVN